MTCDSVACLVAVLDTTLFRRYMSPSTLRGAESASGRFRKQMVVPCLSKSHRKKAIKADKEGPLLNRSSMDIPQSLRKWSILLEPGYGLERRRGARGFPSQRRWFRLKKPLHRRRRPRDRLFPNYIGYLPPLLRLSFSRTQLRPGRKRARPRRGCRCLPLGPSLQKPSRRKRQPRRPPWQSRLPRP